MNFESVDALPAALTVIGTCLVRIVWIFTVFQHYHTLENRFVVFPVSWVITIVLMAIGLIWETIHE